MLTKLYFLFLIFLILTLLTLTRYWAFVCFLVFFELFWVSLISIYLSIGAICGDLGLYFWASVFLFFSAAELAIGSLLFVLMGKFFGQTYYS